MAVDRSGSMSGLAGDVRGSFNTYLDSLVGDEYKYRLTVAMFSHEYRPHCTATKPKEVARLDVTNYRPGGNTALLDAIGRIITDFENATTLADGDKVMLVVQTDGAENCSREYSLGAVKKLIEEREKSGRWSCLFIGAGPDTWMQAEGMGFGRGSTISVASTGAGTQSTYSGLSGATRSFAAGASGDDAAKLIADATK
jgi:Mg-chelatase subunit ChlD